MKKLGQLFSRKKEKQEVHSDSLSNESSIDYLQLYLKEEIKTLLDMSEQIIYSDHIEKFNRKNKKQKRSLLITNKFVYNLKGLSLKRKIDIQKIKKIIQNRQNCEFILNIPDEYDYRYSAQGESQKQIIIDILCSFSQGLQIMYADQIDLAQVVQTKKDMECFLNIQNNGTDKTMIHGINQNNNNSQNQKCSSIIIEDYHSNNNHSITNTINQFTQLNPNQNQNQSSQNPRNSILYSLFSSHRQLNTNSNRNSPQSPKKEDPLISIENSVVQNLPSFQREMRTNFSDFELIEYLGYNSIWRYFRVRECQKSKKICQMRVINIHNLFRQESEEIQNQFVQEQIQLIQELDSNYFTQQYYYIHQGNYFAILQEELDAIKYIDLAQLIDEQSFFPENIAKIIAAQLAYSLHLLHQKKIVYNQINSKNIKIDLAGNAILNRFEFSQFLFTPFQVSPKNGGKLFFKSEHEKQSFDTLTQVNSKKNNENNKSVLSNIKEGISKETNHCYAAPEIINEQPNTYSSDWWSFGILLFEMLLGYTPFYDQSPKQVQQKILTTKEIDFPKMANISPAAKNLILRCLDKNQKTRIKSNEVLSHEFFSDIKWRDIKERVPQTEISSMFNLEQQINKQVHIQIDSTTLKNQGNSPQKSFKIVSENTPNKVNFQEVTQIINQQQILTQQSNQITNNQNQILKQNIESNTLTVFKPEQIKDCNYNEHYLHFEEIFILNLFGGAQKDQKICNENFTMIKKERTPIELLNEA